MDGKELKRYAARYHLLRETYVEAYYIDGAMGVDSRTRFDGYGQDLDVSVDEELKKMPDQFTDLVVLPREIYEGALNYIRHVGANHVMRGEPHPQAWLVDGLEQADEYGMKTRDKKE